MAIVVLFLFSACAGNKKPKGQAITQRDSLPGIATTDVETLISDSGRIAYKIVTPEWDIFDRKNPPRWAFEKGVYLEKYNDLMQVTATIKSDTAYYFEDTKTWELKGNVRIQNEKGEIFTTSQLFWDQRQERVYSSRFIRIENGDNVATGVGFTANQNFTEWEIYNNNAIFTVNENDSVKPAKKDSI